MRSDPPISPASQELSLSFWSFTHEPELCPEEVADPDGPSADALLRGQPQEIVDLDLTDRSRYIADELDTYKGRRPHFIPEWA